MESERPAASPGITNGIKRGLHKLAFYARKSNKISESVALHCYDSDPLDLIISIVCEAYSGPKCRRSVKLLEIDPARVQ